MVPFDFVTGDQATMAEDQEFIWYCYWIDFSEEKKAKRRNKPNPYRDRLSDIHRLMIWHVVSPWEQQILQMINKLSTKFKTRFKFSLRDLDHDQITVKHCTRQSRSYRSQASCRSAPRSKGVVGKIKTKRNGLWVSKGLAVFYRVEDLVKGTVRSRALFLSVF